MFNLPNKKIVNKIASPQSVLEPRFIMSRVPVESDLVCNALTDELDLV